MIGDIRMSQKRIIFSWITIIVIAITIGIGKSYYESQKNQQEIASKILRFHVLANSDEDSDQTLKLEVRDAIGTLMSKKLTDVESVEECENIVNENMNKIVETAQKTIQAQGYNYPVEAYIKQVDFPIKTYGCYTFPAGTYEALEVVIGAGVGHNWWCVMYPNMCFQGSVYEVVEENAKEELEDVLTQKEYESLMEEKDYTVQCKYLKFLNKYLK